MATCSKCGHEGTLKIGDAVPGAAKGAAMGAAAGSLIPIIGTGIGAAIGGFLGFVGGADNYICKNCKHEWKE